MPRGWVDRDAGEMTVSHDAGKFLDGGSFRSPPFLPQSDAFRIASGPNFIGDYVTPGLTQIRFDLSTAVNVLPSDLFIRIIRRVQHCLPTNSIRSTMNSWDTYTVNLAWSFGWNGLSEAAFNAALTSVDALEIQIARSTAAVPRPTTWTTWRR
jgi:hypothetical protein